MAFRATPRQKRSAMVTTVAKSVNTPSSSTTSSSRLIPEVASVDEQSSPASPSTKSKPHSYLDVETSKENVTVTVRFRPLSPREIRQGEEIAWYADGDTIVRSENNSSVAYAYDRVFGPTTTTRHVYDVAAQHIVSGSMEGINGTIFAYGVTSSGKTHTMHGDQRSPGIIPLAVKDAFSIIQETPNREFLLRVSYLEIYNEVVNDLLNPAGQNLRIREDLQGTFVEGIKEEVVLSPAHALSLIATGEEHRHVGSTNFNLLSSRSHTIFTLTIESTPYGEFNESEANLSQLNLIDLAGSESSRVETTGLRQKEGAYINKSLLTLGTVISKLTEGKASHIPYRDSKLTRMLQSSLGGQGRISLICTVTPSSSNAEEMHNTLKFAHRAKYIEILASQNKIVDEKSLIKKYQHEIRCLKEELEQLKKGMLSVGSLKGNGGDDIILLRKKLEDGHVKLQSRLEQEEEAKAALLGRIQRLTKLILVSTKTEHSPRFNQHPVHRRRHSFGEQELSYLPFRRRDLIMEDENCDFFGSIEGFGETDYSSKEEKKNRKHGLLNWFKLRKRDSSIPSADGDKSKGIKLHTTPSPPEIYFTKPSLEPRISNLLQSEISPVIAREETSVSEAVTCDNASHQEIPLASTIAINHADLLREQLKILSEDVALSSSVLKRLSDKADNSPKKNNIQVEIRKVDDEMKAKKQQIAFLEKSFADLVSANKCSIEEFDLSLSYAALLEQLNEKTFELEVKAADNRVIQDQLQQKICECEQLKETVTSLRQQLSEVIDKSNSSSTSPAHCSHQECDEDLEHKISELTIVKTHLELQNQKLAEESQYAKGLASAAGVELKALSDEVTKLMNRNERLAGELTQLRNSSLRKPSNGLKVSRGNNHNKRRDPAAHNYDREAALEATLIEKEQRETELQKKIEESKQKETFLEAELSNMLALVSTLKKAHGTHLDD